MKLRKTKRDVVVVGRMFYRRTTYENVSRLTSVLSCPDPYEDHSSSLRLITIKPMTAQPTYSYPSSSSHSQDSVVLNGEVSRPKTLNFG